MEITEAFQVFDTNGDRSLSVTELVDAIGFPFHQLFTTAHRLVTLNRKIDLDVESYAESGFNSGNSDDSVVSEGSHIMDLIPNLFYYDFEPMIHSYSSNRYSLCEKKTPSGSNDNMDSDPDNMDSDPDDGKNIGTCELEFQDWIYNWMWDHDFLNDNPFIDSSLVTKLFRTLDIDGNSELTALDIKNFFEYIHRISGNIFDIYDFDTNRLTSKEEYLHVMTKVMDKDVEGVTNDEWDPLAKRYNSDELSIYNLIEANVISLSPQALYFALYDTNRDGELQKSESTSFLVGFFDDSGTRMLTHCLMTDLVDSSYYQHTYGPLQLVFGLLDASKNEFLDFMDLRKLTNSKKRIALWELKKIIPDYPKLLLTVFNALDFNLDGFLDNEDFEENLKHYPGKERIPALKLSNIVVLMWLGHPARWSNSAIVPDEIFAEVFEAMIDDNQDGLLSFEEVERLFSMNLTIHRENHEKYDAECASPSAEWVLRREKLSKKFHRAPEDVDVSISMSYVDYHRGTDPFKGENAELSQQRTSVESAQQSFIQLSGPNEKHDDLFDDILVIISAIHRSLPIRSTPGLVTFDELLRFSSGDENNDELDMSSIIEAVEEKLDEMTIMEHRSIDVRSIISTLFNAEGKMTRSEFRANDLCEMMINRRYCSPNFKRPGIDIQEWMFLYLDENKTTILELSELKKLFESVLHRNPQLAPQATILARWSHQIPTGNVRTLSASFGVYLSILRGERGSFVGAHQAHKNFSQKTVMAKSLKEALFHMERMTKSQALTAQALSMLARKKKDEFLIDSGSIIHKARSSH
eukprot:GHVL01005449.1.p1 GENE.GHVL01005449.1~~GHVL01005449.1.p1  ORF type:complete len:806 (+),score=103.80 GHVL01005449.1:227-2644(+)